MATRNTGEDAATARSLAAICFKIGSFTALIGFSLGLYMGASADHRLIPVHVHVNLLGWVGMFLIGFYYKAYPPAVSCIAAIQMLFWTAGYVLMTGGLAGSILTSVAVFPAMVAAGSVLVWLGMAMFAYIVARTA